MTWVCCSLPGREIAGRLGSRWMCELVSMKIHGVYSPSLRKKLFDKKLCRPAEMRMVRGVREYHWVEIEASYKHNTSHENELIFACVASPVVVGGGGAGVVVTAEKIRLIQKQINTGVASFRAVFFQ